LSSDVLAGNVLQLKTHSQCFRRLLWDGPGNVGRGKSPDNLEYRNESFVTVESDGDVEAPIGQLLGDQRCRLAIILDAKKFFARSRHFNVVAGMNNGSSPARAEASPVVGGARSQLSALPAVSGAAIAAMKVMTASAIR
jgi:hypothetical protein